MDWFMSLPLPVALAAVAVLGYLVGRRSQSNACVDRHRARHEMKRAKAVIRRLEDVAQQVRRSLAMHHGTIVEFKERVSKLSRDKEDAAWQALCREADKMLEPTSRLAAQIAQAYDEIRKQTGQLLTFTEVRTDPLTGLSNRRSLDESLESMFALMARYGSSFSLAIFDIDHLKRLNEQWGHEEGDRILQQVARLFDEQIRETDLVARYGGEEFVVLMPETPLEGASAFAERMRECAARELSITLSGGVAAALDGDNPRTLISRADAALYSAKAGGRNRVFQHTGTYIEPVADEGEKSTETAFAEAASECGGGDARPLPSVGADDSDRLPHSAANEGDDLCDVAFDRFGQLDQQPVAP